MAERKSRLKETDILRHRGAPGALMRREQRRIPQTQAEVDLMKKQVTQKWKEWKKGRERGIIRPLGQLITYKWMLGRSTKAKIRAEHKDIEQAFRRENINIAHGKEGRGWKESDLAKKFSWIQKKVMGRPVGSRTFLPPRPDSSALPSSGETYYPPYKEEEDAPGRFQYPRAQHALPGRPPLIYRAHPALPSPRSPLPPVTGRIPALPPGPPSPRPLLGPGGIPPVTRPALPPGPPDFETMKRVGPGYYSSPRFLEPRSNPVVRSLLPGGVQPPTDIRGFLPAARETRLKLKPLTKRSAKKT